MAVAVFAQTMDELFWRSWAPLSFWLLEQRGEAARKWHHRRILRDGFARWVKAADIFPPPLVSDSESDSDGFDVPTPWWQYFRTYIAGADSVVAVFSDVYLVADWNVMEEVD